MLESLSEEGEAGRRRTPPWLTLLMVAKQQWRHKAADAFPPRCCCKYSSLHQQQHICSCCESCLKSCCQCRWRRTGVSVGRPPVETQIMLLIFDPRWGFFCTEVLCLVEFSSLWETCVSLELRQAGRLSPVSPARDAGSLQSSNYCTFIWKSA